ncbi:MAG: SNF2-related protein [Burkholderiales bacterium]
MLRDDLDIERTGWDHIILDEARRIKNWEARTSRIIKSLRSRFALVLTGTPLENRLDDLYSVVEFIDDRRLGPAYRFIHRHRVASDTGKVLGHKNLDALRERLKPVLLRCTRVSIALDLPWNPAMLEQRIARAHRMGQKRRVQVYLLVTENTIEENLLATLSAKHELAAAVLDPDSDLREMQLVTGIEELKRRLEWLLGAKPMAPSDES